MHPGPIHESLKQAREWVLAEYGSRGYDFWKAMIGKDEIMLPHPNDPGLEIGVSSMWDAVKPGGAIRVIVSTFELKPTRFRVSVPTTSFLVFEDNSLR
jgi:hypothetical protein